MRTLRSLAAVFALMLTAAAIHAAPAAGKGYTLVPPSTWKVNQSGMMGTDILVFAPPAKGFAPNLNVVITPAAAGETLEQGQAQMLKLYPRMFTQFKMVKTGFETVGGQRALLIVGMHTQAGRQLYMRQDVVLHGGKVYTFTCTAPAATQAKYAPGFNTLLKSVKWSH